MSPGRPDVRSHYQLRLVKRIENGRVVTHGSLANAKGVRASDKTLDVFQASNDRAALQRAREYNRRSARNKGSLPGEYQGVVVVKYVSDPTKPALVSQPTRGRVPEVKNRRSRVRGTTDWLFYLEPDEIPHHLHPKNHRVQGLATWR